MKLAKFFSLSIIILIINSCAFYSLKGTIPVHIKNIYIAPIINKSMDQEVIDFLDNELNQLIINQNILEVVNYDNADSKLDITVIEVLDLPYTLSQGTQYEKVDEWKFLIKANVVWSDFKKGEVLFNINIISFNNSNLFISSKYSHKYIKSNVANITTNFFSNKCLYTCKRFSKDKVGINRITFASSILLIFQSIYILSSNSK